MNSIFLTDTLSNTMFGEVDIVGSQVNHLKGQVVVRKDNQKQFKGFFTTPLFSQTQNMKGILTVKQEKLSQFKGNVIIGLENIMLGEMSSLDTPENKHYGVLTQDSYTLGSSPNINYGEDSILYFSNDSTVFLDYLFSPNDFSLFDQDNELDSYLQIYIDRTFHKKTVGRIYIVNEDWYESAITDNNKPSMKQFIDFEVPLNYVGWVDIPLNELLVDHDKLSPFRISLAVKIDTDSFARSYSKEGSYDLSPKMYYKYQYVPPAARIRQFSGLVKIKLNNSQAIKGKVVVDSGYGDSLLKGIVTIPTYENSNTFKGKVFVLQRPIDQRFKGIVDVPVFNKEKNFTGKINIKAIGNNKFNGLIDVPVYQKLDKISGNLTVQLEREARISGSLNIPVSTRQSLFTGKVGVRLDEEKIFNGFINVPLMNNIDTISGKITVRKDSSQSFMGKMNIPLLDEIDCLSGRVVIRKDNEDRFKGLLNVELRDSKNQFSGLIGVQEIWRDMFMGTMNVPRYEVVDKFAGEIFIPHTRVNKLKSKVFVKSQGRNKAYVYIM